MRAPEAGQRPARGARRSGGKAAQNFSGRQRAGRVRGVITPRTTRPALSGGRLRAASLSAPARCPPARRPTPAGRQIARAQRKSKGFTSGSAALAFPWAACRFAAALWLAPLRRAWVVLSAARSGPRLRPPLPLAAPGAACAVPARLPVAASKVRCRSPWRLRRRKRRLAVPGPLAGGGAGALQAAPFKSAAPAPGGGGGDRPPLPRLPAFIRRRGGAAPDRREFPGGRRGRSALARWPPLPLGTVVQGENTIPDELRPRPLLQPCPVETGRAERMGTRPCSAPVQITPSAADAHAALPSGDFEPIRAVFASSGKPAKKFRKITFYHHNVVFSPPKSSHNTN